MAIPDYQSIMLPLLKLSADGEIHQFCQTVETLAKDFQLTDEERKELLPSGKQPTFHNRVGWARTYMAKAGLLDSPKRGTFKITDRGRKVIAQDLKEIDKQFLEQYPEFNQFQQIKRDKVKTTISSDNLAIKETPEEVLESAYQNLRGNLVQELLINIKNCSPEFFERLVVDLLLRMGYGGSRKEAGEAVGRSSDGGIDGIIKEDRLGLDIIYIQAKRWEAVVGRPDIQKFSGALLGQRAIKGIFLTTSSFSREALDYVSNIQSKIILIDGMSLAEMMIDHGVGVTTETIYELKRIDSDYFSEE